jgi:hypothetical protein
MFLALHQHLKENWHLLLDLYPFMDLDQECTALEQQQLFLLLLLELFLDCTEQQAAQHLLCLCLVLCKVAMGCQGHPIQQ